eukprot:5586010-Pleurochrysis_carterae.AAC.1
MQANSRKKGHTTEEANGYKSPKEARATTGEAARESWAAFNPLTVEASRTGPQMRGRKPSDSLTKGGRNKKIGRRRGVGGPPSKESGGPMPQKA